MEINELQHRGVKGMKWGQRLYQNKDGSLTALGKIRYGNKKNLTVAKRKATIAGKKKAAEKAKKAEDKKNKTEDVEATKERVLKSRSAKDLYENAHLFSTQELQTAYNRLMLEKNIKSLSPAEVNKGEQFMANAAKKMGTAADMISSGSKLYNNIAAVLNTFTDADLPKIGNNKFDLDTKKKERELKRKEAEKKLRDFEKAEKAEKAEKLKKAEKGKDDDKKNKDKKDKKNKKEEPDFHDAYWEPKKKKESYDPDEIIGEGTSKGSYKPKDGPIFDADFTSDNLPVIYRSSGKSQVSNSRLLGQSTSNLPALYSTSGEDYVQRFLLE